MHQAINELLVIRLRKIGHKIRYFSDGKGGQNRILMVLFTNPDMTQQQLTEYLDIKPGSVSEVLYKLEKGGFIQRHSNPNDRRTCTIQLTELGRTHAEIVLEKKKENYEMMFQDLNTQEKEVLLQLLEKINLN